MGFDKYFFSKSVGDAVDGAAGFWGLGAHNWFPFCGCLFYWACVFYGRGEETFMSNMVNVCVITNGALTTPPRNTYDRHIFSYQKGKTSW